MRQFATGVFVIATGDTPVGFLQSMCCCVRSRVHHRRVRLTIAQVRRDIASPTIEIERPTEPTVRSAAAAGAGAIRDDDSAVQVGSQRRPQTRDR